MGSYRGPCGGDDFGQKFPQPLEDEARVVADGVDDGVDVVAEAAFEEVSAQATVGFAMADDGFDGRSSPEFLLDLAVDAALLAGFEDPARLRRVVAAIAFVDIGALDHVGQGVAVIGIAGQGLGVEDELAALGAPVGGGERGLDAELVRRSRLALADALGLGRMP